MKEAWKSQKDGSNASIGFIIQEGDLRRGSSRELESTAAYTLGVDIGEQSGRKTPLGGKILLGATCQFLEARCGPSNGF
jgi:hypothetical protein